MELVQFIRRTSTSKLSRRQLTDSARSRIDPHHVVLINHGWSPLVGPNYPIIRTLETVAQNLGWKCVVPDFRPAYRMGNRRSRSERVKMIYEAMLCLQPKPKVLVLVGHSQGGAASALACTDAVVDACNIAGLLLLGSESPLSLDGMGWSPKVPHVRIVHAAQDRVIGAHEMRWVAKQWGRPLTELESTVQLRANFYQGDELAHDFLCKDLLLPAIDIFESLLAACHSDPANASRQLSTVKKTRRSKLKRRRAAKSKPPAAVPSTSPSTLPDDLDQHNLSVSSSGISLADSDLT